jgi:uncharacterized protein (TIGR00369 family)
MTVRRKEITWHDPADAVAEAATLPGRELFERVRDGRLPAPPMARLFGFEILEVGDGEVRFACTPDESTVNPMGIVHGGTLCTLLDTVAGCALHTTLPAGVAYSTIEIKVSFLRALVPGTRLEAVGRLIRRGRTVAFAEGTVTDDQGRLVGTATTSLMIAGAPA